MPSKTRSEAEAWLLADEPAGGVLAWDRPAGAEELEVRTAGIAAMSRLYQRAFAQVAFVCRYDVVAPQPPRSSSNNPAAVFGGVAARFT